ncbi:MAG: hypothetical protein RLZZ69_3855, partial [Cyanobacteriota bacterium]
SDVTLNKPENLPLWHPKYRPQAKINPNPTTIVEPENPIDPNIVLDVSVPEVTGSLAFKARACLSPPSAVKENNTEELATKIDLLPTPNNSTAQELNNFSETLSTPDAPQAAELSTVIHKALQPEQPNNKQDNHRATPLPVIREKDENQEPLKPIPSIKSNLSCHTLPIMKGVILDSLLRVLYQVLQRAYCEAIIKKRNLVLFFQGHQENSFTGLVERKGQKRHQQSKIASIPINSEVTVKKSQLHSSYFRDYPNQILVYIKPLIGAEDWRGGIPVPLESLSPLRIKNKKKNQNQSNQNQLKIDAN